MDKKKPNQKPCNSKTQKLCKRLAAKVQAPKAVEEHQVKKETKDKNDGRLTCWGCARCRGNVFGCDNCNSQTPGRI